ncbi:transaminase [hydrothermal vent metagenome]|uniref:Transaminase n=1 Tax=hydrothermal vent metagenome TaxID=652676 RepID=A0A3B0ZGK5_9ZZZZ
MKKYLLFTPGPVNVAENVRRAICKDDICHRESDFDYLLQRIETKLLKLFAIKNTADYRAVVITGSGTAANESMLSSVVGHKRILILSNGEFGERLYNISKVHNKNTFRLEFGWGEDFDLEKIQAYLQTHEIDIVAMVHHETSSGMLNPLEKIGTLCKKNRAMFIVDCVSSAGAEMIDMEKCHIAFCSSSSSKAICSYSGLSFVIGKTNEFDRLRELPVKTTYLNLYKFYEFIKDYSQTPNTPAVHLFYALEQALDNIFNMGIAHHYAVLKDKARILRDGMSHLGLTFLVDEKDMCSVLTTVHLPSHIDVTLFRQKLRDKSIIIYEGKGRFKNKVFQVGNIGELSYADIQFFLDSLENILHSFEKVKVKIIPFTRSLKSMVVYVNGGTESGDLATAS